jgi:hypothetical protein
MRSGIFSGRLILPGLMLASMILMLTACGPVEAPQMMEARADQCVQPVDVMRRDHMKILHTEKDQAVNLGLRNPKHSLRGCVDCHVSPTANREDPGTHFCLNCHSFNAVRMDCFQCHTDKPADDNYRHAINPHSPAFGFQASVDADSLNRDLETILALEKQEP